MVPSRQQEISCRMGIIPMNIEVFENKEFGQIRTVEDEGQILFCGKDIAAALGYANTKDALARHCKQDGVVKRYKK